MHIKALLSTKITELILAVILVTSRYENQFLSLSYTANAAIAVKLGYRKMRQKLAPAHA